MEIKRIFRDISVIKHNTNVCQFTRIVSLYFIIILNIDRSRVVRKANKLQQGYGK